MWAAFVNSAEVPPFAFAVAAIFAKSSTLYNPIVYLVFKPNFRRSLCRDWLTCRRTLCACLCSHGSAQKVSCTQSQQHGKEECNSTRRSNGLTENHRGACRHCPCPERDTGSGGYGQETTPQRTARILQGSTHSEVAVSQLSNEMQSDFLWKDKGERVSKREREGRIRGEKGGEGEGRKLEGGKCGRGRQWPGGGEREMRKDKQ